MLFDDIIFKIGEFGIYQRVLYVLLGLVGIPTGWQHASIVFKGAFQDHWCEVSRLSNFSATRQRYLAIPWTGADGYSKCSLFDINFDRYTDEELRKWNRSLRVSQYTPIIKCDSWVFDQSEFRTTLSSDMGLVCDHAYLQPLVFYLYMCGFLIGSVAFGAISDRFGRHKTMVLCLCVEMSVGLTATFITNYPAFVILRFIVGTAVAGAFNTAFVMVMEMIGPSRRMGAGIFVQGWFAVGSMSLAAIAYSFREQKRLQFVCAAPVIILMLYYWIVPESPRWLASRGRYQDAEKVLRRMAAVNGRELPDVLHLEENRRGVKRRPVSVDTVSTGNIYDLIRTPNLRKKSWMLSYLCFANAFLLSAFDRNVKLIADNLYLTRFLAGFLEIPIYVLCVVVMDRKGRRWPLFGLLTVSLIMTWFSIGFLGEEAPYAGLITCALLGRILAAGANATVYVYATELLPTDIRNVGVGVCALFGSVGTILATDFSTNGWPPLALILASMLGMGALFVSFFLPETLDHDLPETVEQAERFAKGSFMKFVETGNINKPFKVHREPRQNLNLGPACSLSLGLYKVEVRPMT